MQCSSKNGSFGVSSELEEFGSLKRYHYNDYGPKPLTGDLQNPSHILPLKTLLVGFINRLLILKVKDPLKKNRTKNFSAKNIPKIKLQ